MQEIITLPSLSKNSWYFGSHFKPFIMPIKNTVPVPSKPLSSQEMDLAAISAFLCSETEIEQQHAKLEAIIQKRAGNRYDATKRTLVDFVPGQPLKHNKLLTDYLREWASENGFSGLVNISTFLDAKQFGSLLANKSLFKDKLFRGSAHGYLTHIFQWWWIVEANKEKKFLTHPPHELYGWMGEQQVNHGRIDYWLTTSEFPGFGISSVFKHNTFLLGEFCRKYCPVLYQLVAGREIKKTNRLSLGSVE